MRDTSTLRSLIESSRRRMRDLSDATRTVRSHIAPVLRWMAEPLAVVAVTLMSTTAFAQPFYVPSGSMEPTIAIGDALVAAKFPYGYSS